MKMGDKDGTGTIDTGELHVLLLKYKKYRHDNPAIKSLIQVFSLQTTLRFSDITSRPLQKWDKDRDMKLSQTEIKGLLGEVSDKEITDADAEFVLTMFAEYSGGVW